MRILILHSRYRSGSVSGENRVVDDEATLLRHAGYQVATWTPSLPEGTSIGATAAAGVGSVWSLRAAANVRGFLRRNEVDVLHVHNLFPMLSPSVLRAAHASRVGVVVTLHNYRLICLPATLLRDGRPCEDCIGRTPWPGVLHRCYRSSRPASAAIAASLSVHRAAGTFDGVRRFLAVSDFVRAKHVQGGLSPDRITVKPNFAWPSPPRSGPGDHFLYAGRLSKEKGVTHLIEAARSLDAPLLVAGDGPERRDLEAYATHRVQFLGSVKTGGINELLRATRALVVPSLWYEGAPRVIAEASAAGVPTIASRIGGLPESVVDGRSGLLVPPGDAGALREALTHLLEDDVSLRLGMGAHELWQERFSPDRAIALLEEVYRAVR